MYEFTRTYQGLGRPLYTRSSGGLGRPLYARTYGGLGMSPFTRSYGGLGADRAPTVTGTGAAAIGAVGTVPISTAVPSTTASSADIRNLQTAIQASGCNPGPIDGLWGARTQRGLECFAGRVGWNEVSSRFPWAVARVAEARETAKQNGGTTTTTTVDEDQGPEVVRAGIFPFELPGVLNEWWFWIAAVGITGLGVAGYLQYKKSKSGRRFEEVTHPAIPSALRQWR